MHPSSEVQMSAEPGDIIPTNNDIIIGRGAFINNHQGNIQFRNLCYEKKERFDTSSPGEKRICASEIMDTVKRMVPPGRFLKRDPGALQAPVLTGDGSYQLPPRGLEGPWEEVSDDKACAKTIQVLRDLKVREAAGMHQMATAHHHLLPHAEAGMIHHHAYEQPVEAMAVTHVHLQEPDATGMEALQQEDSQIAI